ncbi:hypothetical protein AB7M74_007114 [Bradyrhizobium japonicum]
MMIPMITNTATNEGRAVTREDGRTGKIGETHADESFDVIFDDNGGTVTYDEPIKPLLMSP